MKINCENQSLFAVELKNFTTMQKKPLFGFDAVFFITVFRVVAKLCVVFKPISAEKKLFSTSCFKKMPTNEATTYQETDFPSTEGHLLTSSGCFLSFLALASSLDVVQVRFAFVAFCL